MKHMSREYLLGSPDSHIYSEPEFRIQVLEIPRKERPLWEIQHGRLLVNILSGHCLLRTNMTELILKEGDQVVLEQGESFNLVNNMTEEAIGELLWAPGM